MIDKLKRKFVIIATVFMFILMTLLLFVMNMLNYREMVSESDSVLDVVAQPGAPFFDEKMPPAPDEMNRFLPRGMSMEVPYESRFFTVTVSPDGNILNSDLSRIISVDEEVAKGYINRIINSKSDRGFIENFRYSKEDDMFGTRIVFLDCGRRLDSFRNFLKISVMIGLSGCVIVFFAFMLTAGKIVAPIAESYEKQKRFISDAGHEIKTPLTIINANVDLMEIDGEKEELTDIRNQTERLTKLTNDLIMLSKMEEASDTIQKIDFPVSDLVSDTASSFKAPASTKNIDYSVNIEPGLSLNGSPDAIRQLISLILENAFKYTNDSGKISLDMKAQKKTLMIKVTNTTDLDIDEKDISHVFDRFYRSDKSRNSETGGHGIGLSIAKAITDAHGGHINASTSTGHDFSVNISLPF